MSDAKGYDATLEEVINTYTYNTNGQLIKEVNPSGSMVEYKYDATGNVILKTDEDGYVTTYLYDQVNNLVKETYGDGKETTYTYNPLNQVISMTDWLGTNTYDLDAIGRLKSVKDYKNRTTAYTWDGESNRTSITYPDRSTVNYTYDQKGQLISVTDANKGITSYTYDKLGNVLSEKLANGDKTTYSYDVLSRLNTITAKDSKGNLLYNNAFEYDAVGNKTSGIEEVSKNNNGNNNNSNNNSSYNRNENGYKSEYGTITYVYDALDQLIKVTNPDNSVEKYFYDTLGNRVQKEITIPGKNENKESTTNVTKYTYNKDNQMLTLQGIEEEVALHQTSDLVNFEYDGRGNVIKISTQEGIIGQYRYDATNKMTHAINKKGIRSEYIYDGAGRRVKQKVEEPNINVPEKSSLHDGAYFEEKFGISSTEDIDYKKEMNYIVDITSIYNNVLKVYGENTKTQRYTYGLDVISMDTWHEKTQDNGNEKINDKTLYYINNELGSVVKLVDGKDKVKAEYSYDTFGVVAEKNHVNDQSIRSNIFHYTGYQYDYQTGLYFANARYYMAEVGRFAEEDVYKGDGLNRYVYVRNNPLRYVDRSGYSSSEGTGNSEIEYVKIDTSKLSNMTIHNINYFFEKVLAGKDDWCIFNGGSFSEWFTAEDFERALDWQLEQLQNPTYAAFDSLWKRVEKFADGSLQLIGGGTQALAGYGIATLGSWGVVTVPAGIIVGADGLSNGAEGLEKLYDAIFTSTDDKRFNESFNVIRDWAFKGVLGDQAGEQAYNYFTLGTGVVAFAKTGYDIYKSGAIKNIFRTQQAAKAKNLKIPLKNKIIEFGDKIIIHTVDATDSTVYPMITRKIIIDVKELAKKRYLYWH
jgi:RHS repeat-associated protein